MCLAGHLPAINHAMDGNTGAALTVAATLLPGRCRTGFATEARASAAVAAAGRALRAAVIGGDPNAVRAAMSAWTKSVDRWSDHAAGPAVGSCRPLR
jgi:DNA-binding FadR family transcriptional regulator